jgi:hypothetical protein
VDALLLMVQVLLVILLIVIPLFSGYDKWQSWTPRRKVIASILGVGIGVVAFSQYQRIVWLRKSGLEHAVAGVESHGSWVSKPILVHPIEYVAGWVLGATLLAFAFQEWRRRRFKQAAGYGAVFTVLLLVSLAVKLRWWRA